MSLKVSFTHNQGWWRTRIFISDGLVSLCPQPRSLVLPKFRIFPSWPNNHPSVSFCWPLLPPFSSRLALSFKGKMWWVSRSQPSSVLQPSAGQTTVCKATTCQSLETGAPPVCRECGPVRCVGMAGTTVTTSGCFLHKELHTGPILRAFCFLNRLGICVKLFSNFVKLEVQMLHVSCINLNFMSEHYPVMVGISGHLT